MNDAKPETWRTRFLRWGFNFFPAFLGTGGRIEYIASDFKYVRVGVPLNWRTKNYVGTTFGGSMYGAVDPIYMVMFIRILGPAYIVWDKSAEIRFRKPGRSKLTAEFRVSDAEIGLIKTQLEGAPKFERTFKIDITDAEDATCATVLKVLHFAKKLSSKPTVT